MKPTIDRVRHALPLRTGKTDTYEIDDGWIVQIARTPDATTALRRQAVVLPRLAPHLPRPIPNVSLVSRDPVAIAYRKLPGRGCRGCPMGAWPEQLGGFVTALHRVDPAVLELPVTPTGDVRSAVRIRCEQMQTAIGPYLASRERVRAGATLAAYLDAENWQFTPVIRHNDLGPEHVLVSETGELVGVIDWEQIGVGEPAWELAWWMHAMPDAGHRIRAAYEPRDARFDVRCRYAGLLMTWHDTERAIATGDVERIEAAVVRLRAGL